MIILNATTKSLEAVLAGAVAANQLPIVANYVDVTATTYTPGESDTQTNGTTGVTAVAAPAASTQRQVKLLTAYNADTAAGTLTLRYNNNGTLRTLHKVTLAAGALLVYTDGEGFRVLDSSGAMQQTGGSSGGSGAFTVISNTATGAVNDWAPAGMSGNTLIEWNGAADFAPTGLAGGVAGQIIIFKNITAAKIATFANLVTSAAGNQFTNYVTSAVTPVAPKGTITFHHDGTNWKIVGHEQGTWITQPYASGDFTASSGTWTVDSGDVQLFKYKLVGTTLLVSWAIGTTSVSATPNTLLIKIPGGFSSVAAGAQSGPHFYHEASGAAYIFGEMWISPSTLTLMTLYPTGFGSGTVWGTTTNNTATYATMAAIEVS